MSRAANALRELYEIKYSKNLSNKADIKNTENRDAKSKHNSKTKELTPKLLELINLVKDKNIFLGCHWDADGITSGAIIYHLIKPHAKSISTISKGHVFLIEPSDIPKKLNDEIDYVITVDIQPGYFSPSKVIYIDHHPISDTSKFAYTLHDPDIQSCSLLIWDKLIKNSPYAKNPYFVFLSIVGFFGDGGRKELIPAELSIISKELLEELMIERNSYYNNGTYLLIEKYVSLFNIGKRAHWSGDLPFSMLKTIDSLEPLLKRKHHIINELEHYRQNLKEQYQLPIKLKSVNGCDLAMIESSMNIQGVLCARHMKKNPIIVLNSINGMVIGSMRVPDDLDFDAGSFLEDFKNQISDFAGGGHEKAGGFSLSKENLDLFLNLLSR